MSGLRFRTKPSGLPVLSKYELDELAEEQLRQFAPAVLQEPAAVDVDSFALVQLGMHQEFWHLSHNGVYLGMTVFNDTDRLPIYDPKTKRAEYISVRANTMLIDTSLSEDGNINRYRFTVAHEAGHSCLHTDYSLRNCPDAAAARSEGEPALIRCRVENFAFRKPLGEWTDADWLEWQANHFASSLLMPRSMVFRLVNRDNDKRDEIWAAASICRVANVFEVSRQAAEIRLRDVGLLDGFSAGDIAFGMDFMGDRALPH